MKLGFDAKRLFHNATGLGNYSRDLIRILSQFYPEHQYLLYHPKTKSIDRLPLTNGISERLPEGFWNKKIKTLWRSKNIVKQLLKDNIQIYHGLSGELPIGIDKTPIKTIVTIHDLIFMRYPKYYSFFDRNIHLRKFQHAVNIADQVVAISEQTKKDIVDFLGVPSNKVCVIYQGCHYSFKKDYTASEMNLFHQKHHLPPQFILYVGTIEPRKNLLSLVKSLYGTDIPLVAVGKKTKYFKRIQTFIESRQMQNQVRFLEGLEMDSLAKLYHRTTIFCYPSLFEGFGIPIIEALYSGTPVITSKGSCFSEAGGSNSIYIEPNNIKALSNNIQQLWYDSNQREKMAESGKKYAHRFDDRVVAQQYINLYKELLKNKD